MESSNRHNFVCFSRIRVQFLDKVWGKKKRRGGVILAFLRRFPFGGVWIERKVTYIQRKKKKKRWAKGPTEKEEWRG